MGNRMSVILPVMFENSLKTVRALIGECNSKEFLNIMITSSVKSLVELLYDHSFIIITITISSNVVDA